MRLFNRKKDQGTKLMSSREFAASCEALIPAEVRMISGCHAEQTSADVSNVASSQLPDPAGRAGGACTSALLELLWTKQHTKDLTFQKVLLELREKLARSGYDQIPQLTSSRPLELKETPFSLAGNDENGTKRALLVGINYRGQNGQLVGCHNDVYNMKRYLTQLHGYQDRHCLVLVDDREKSRHYPTRQLIIAALCQLVKFSQPGDSVFFHYSGTYVFKDENHSSEQLCAATFFL